MAYNVLEAISEEERLNFSQNFSVKRPGILDTIFPDVKMIMTDVPKELIKALKQRGKR